MPKEKDLNPEIIVICKECMEVMWFNEFYKHFNCEGCHKSCNEPEKVKNKVMYYH